VRGGPIPSPHHFFSYDYHCYPRLPLTVVIVDLLRTCTTIHLELDLDVIVDSGPQSIFTVFLGFPHLTFRNHRFPALPLLPITELY